MNTLPTDQPNTETDSTPSPQIESSPIIVTQTEKQPTQTLGLNSKKIRLILAGIFLFLLMLGGGTALYLSQISQDIRQQASTGGYGPGYECRIGDPNACGGRPERCHCLGGDLCTGTECDDTLWQACGNWGRSYCTNYQGFGMTCCEVGYVCCPTSDGCCPGSGPTNTPRPTDRPGDPTPTTTLTTPTPTPTRNPSITPTRTPTPTQGPSPTPTSGPSPTPTPPVSGPQCHDIRMFYPGGTEITGDMDQELQLGESVVQFRCSATGGTPNRYEFRVLRPDGQIEDGDTNPALQAVGALTGEYLLTQSGTYHAQCRICTTDECHPYEELPANEDLSD
jgi:hypothetical protein